MASRSATRRLVLLGLPWLLVTNVAVAEDHAEPARRVVVVTPFDVRSRQAADQELGQLVAETLAISLTDQKHVSVIALRRVREELDGQRLTPAQLTTPATAAKLGKRMLANFVVSGRITSVDGSDRLSYAVQVVAVDRAQRIGAVKEDGTRADVEATILALASRLAKLVGTQLPDINAATLDASPDGRFHLVRGICLYHAGQSREAIVHCLRAVQRDPRLLEARLWIARAYLKLDHESHAKAELQRLAADPAAEPLRSEVDELVAQCARLEPASQQVSVPSAEPVANAYRRWAIVATPAVLESGLPDLLTTDLARIPEIELLERSELALATNELELGGLLDSSNAAGRLELGRLLKADALLLLSFTANGDQQLLRIVISDCVYGARLHAGVIPHDGQPLEFIRRRVLREFEQTRNRFAGGIRWIAGVPAFVSHDLIHDFDELQAGYAELVADSLAQLSGVAVIESSEAQAIRREIDLSGETLKDRLVPVLIEGEFRTANTDDQGGRSVTFTVTLKSSATLEREIKSPALPLANAGDYLRETLCREILKGLKIDTPIALSKQAQFDALTERAAAFADLGSWEYSTGLREASLLLHYDDAEQRIALIKEYAAMIHQDMPQELLEERRRVIPTREKLDELLSQGPRQEALDKIKREQAAHQAHFIEWYGRRLSRWRMSLAHLEFLIRSSQLKREDALQLCQSVVNGMRELPPGSLEPFAEPMRELEKEKQAFLRHEFRRVLELPPIYATPQGHRNAYYFWQNDLFAMLFDHFDNPGRSNNVPPQRKQDLDALVDVLENIVGEPPVASDSLVQFLHGASQRAGKKDYGITRGEFEAFLKSLIESKHRSNQLYGRFGLLWTNWFAASPSERQPEKVLAELQALQADVVQRFPKTEDRSLITTYDDSLTKEVTALVATRGRIVPRPAPPKPPDLPIAGTIRFQPVETTVRKLSGETLPWTKVERRDKDGRPSPIYWFVPCGDTCDVLGGYASVLLHRSPGVFEELFADPNAGFFPPIWDGRYIWLGSRNDGMRVLASDGKVVARATGDQGLPPATGALVMCALEPGKICAVGSMDRAWCALLELADEKIKVNVFHEAALVGPPSDPKTRFSPTFVAPWNGIAANHRGLLIGRAGGLNPPADQYPLQVDLETMSVRCPFAPSIRNGARLYHVLESGDLLCTIGGILYHCAAPGKLLANGKPNEVLRDQTPYFFFALLPYKNAIYLSSSTTWCRVDPATLSAKPWKQAPEKYPQSEQMHGVSAHFGIVGWNYKKREFYRATLEEQNDSPEPSAEK